MVTPGSKMGMARGSNRGFKLYLFYNDYKQARGTYINAFVGTDGGVRVVLRGYISFLMEYSHVVYQIEDIDKTITLVNFLVKMRVIA